VSPGPAAWQTALVTSAAGADGSMAARVVTDFYAAFGRRDHAAMTAFYAPDATFSDPAFGHLREAEVTSMWRMLTEAATDLSVTARDITAHGDRAAATWEARYTFSETGRPVHNIVEAHVTVVDGRIIRHDDHFDFWRWSRQALGLRGLLLGWTPVLRAQVRKRARRRLDEFMAAHPQDAAGIT
jgi:ketosteroid isomerase-like protein